MSKIHNIADLLENPATGKTPVGKSASKGALAVLEFRSDNNTAGANPAVRDFTSHLQPAKARIRTLNPVGSEPKEVRKDSGEARADQPSLFHGGEPILKLAPKFDVSKVTKNQPDRVSTVLGTRYNATSFIRLNAEIIARSGSTPETADNVGERNVPTGRSGLVGKDGGDKSSRPDTKSPAVLKPTDAVAVKSGADKPTQPGVESTASREPVTNDTVRESSIVSKIAPDGRVPTRQFAPEMATGRAETSSAPRVNVMDATSQPLTENPIMFDRGGSENSTTPLINRPANHPLSGTPEPTNGTATAVVSESVRQTVTSKEISKSKVSPAKRELIASLAKRTIAVIKALPIDIPLRPTLPRASTPRNAPVESSAAVMPTLETGIPPQRAVVMPEFTEPTQLPMSQSVESPEVAPIARNVNRQSAKTAEPEIEPKSQALAGAPDNKVVRSRKKTDSSSKGMGENSVRSDAAAANETSSEIGRPVTETQGKEPLRSPAHAKGTTSSYAGHSTLQTPINPANLAQSVRFSLAGGRRELTLQLKPEIMGRALIMMHQEGDELRLEFRLERPEARQAIEAQSTALREALVSAGFQNVTIEVRSDDSSALWNEKAGEDRQQREQNNDRDRAHEEEQNKPRSHRPRNFGYNTFEIAA